MQTRRHEGMVRKSAATKLRDRQYELGHDSFVASHREEQSMRSRSSFSPSRRDGSRRVASGDRNSNSIERRERDWHMSSSRTNRFRSRSPPYGQVLKKAPFEEDVMHRNRSSPPLELQQRYELSESMGNPDAASYHNSRSLHAYDHHNTSRISTDDDFGGHRSSDGMLVQKSMAMEDDEVQRSVRLHQDLGSTSTYKETGGPLSSATTGNMGIRQFEDERLRYRNPLPFDKSSLMEHYKGGDKAMSYLRDIDRTLVPASQFQDFAGTSSGILTSDDRPSYRDAQHLPSNEFSKSSGKFTEALDFDGYGHGQRPLHDAARNREAELRDLSYYRRDAYSPEKAELQGYLYSTLGERGGNDFGYPRDDKKIHGHDRGEYDQMHLPSNSKVEYDQRDVLLHAGLEYDLRDESFHNRVNRHHKDGLRPSMMNSTAIYIDNIKSSHLNFREGNVRNHPSQEQKISEYPNMSRILYSSKQDREYFDYGHSHAEYGGKVSQDHEMSNLPAGMDHEVSQFPSNYDIRDASPGLPKERLKGSFVSEYDAEMDRLGIRRHRMDAEKLGIYDPSGRMLKRKYTMDEEISGYDSRSLASRKLDMPTTRELNGVREKWIDEDIDDFYSSETVGFDHARYRRPDRVLDGRVHQRDLPYDNWFPTEDSHEHVQGGLSKSFHRRSDIHKYHRFIRGHPKPGSPRWPNSYHIKRRSDIHKYPRVLKWSSDDQSVDEHVDGDEPSKDQGYSAKSLAEDTEEFKQLVQSAFLKFSKKLNENPAVRRRYKEQGRAGSLFCIVCGRSLSKDFMDTQRLVTHAFMSYKSGLRAEHLGLHKAICVLLGWNSDADPDTVTWTPEVLSYEEALAQKEDLMLWPPLIIIHNSSILNNGPEDQKVATTEDLEAFLRGKGFVRGKIKVSLGKPADNSVMLVKFLGTFTGLEDANRIHKYFAENKHGRADFEQITVNNGRRCNDKDAGKQEDKLKELDLYGYLGISEDLDKVDFETRKRSLIRSKKEIRDLADDPVKPNER